MKALREPLCGGLSRCLSACWQAALSAPLFSRLFGAAAAGLSEESSERSLSITAGWWWRPASCGNGNPGLGLGWRSPYPPAAFRPRRRSSPLSADLSPVAVLAMAVPVLGFGWLPALIALALYGNCRCCGDTGRAGFDTAWGVKRG